MKIQKELKVFAFLRIVYLLNQSQNGSNLSKQLNLLYVYPRETL